MASVSDFKPRLAIIAVYLAFFLRAFTFILLFPHFTKVLAPSTWGAILSAQALSMWLMILMDFGFTLSLSRKVAVNRENLFQVREDVGNVYSAKLMLLLVSVVLTFFSTQFGVMLHYPSFAWAALFWAVMQGVSPLWYYQAIEEMYFFSIIDIIGRVLYIVLCLNFIRSTEDAILILIFQGTALAVVNILTIFRLWRNIDGFRLSFKGGYTALKDGLILSGFSVLTSIYTTASTFLFGIFASPSVVPQYGNADRLLRSGISLLGPLNQLVLPKSSRAFAQSYNNGIRYARKMFYVYAFIGIFGYAVSWFLAPTLISVLFDSRYANSLEYFRRLLILFPITAVNTVIVYHILIPNNLESLITIVYSIVSLLTLLLIYVLVPKFGVDGMIYSMLLPEILVLIVFGGYMIFSQNIAKRG